MSRAHYPIIFKADPTEPIIPPPPPPTKNEYDEEIFVSVLEMDHVLGLEAATVAVYENEKRYKVGQKVKVVGCQSNGDRTGLYCFRWIASIDKELAIASDECLIFMRLSPWPIFR